MSSSNYRRNKAFIDKFRKELKEMVEDIEEIDKRVLNQSVNEGIKYAKDLTQPGKHPNPVQFTIKHGPRCGEVVSFKTDITVKGGELRKGWTRRPTEKINGGIQVEIINRKDYAVYWNNGHRIVSKKGGPTKGFVKGTFLLQKTQNYIGKQMQESFEKEVKAVQKRHDK